MIENPGEPAYTAYYGAPGAGVNKSQQTAMAQPGRGEKYGDQYGAAATAYRTEQGMGPIEGLNRAMAENPYARYGVAGTAAVGGGGEWAGGDSRLPEQTTANEWMPRVWEGGGRTVPQPKTALPSEFAEGLGG